MPIIRLSSLGDSRLDAYARLTEAQLRNRLEPEKGIFIAESIKVIDRALAAAYEPISFLMEEKWLDASTGVIDRVQSDVPVFVLPADELKRLTGFELTRGILAAMRRPVLPSVENLLADAHRVAVLEGVVDHTNVGAIFRSAAALGIDAVLVTPSCCDPLYRRAVRVSMGTVFQVPWTRIGSTVEDWPEAGLALLRSLGFATAAFALTDESLSIDDERLHACDRLAMVFGTEGDGLAQSTIARCDYTVKIPMAHGVDSLNVAAASAVAFWELRER
ncbi:TrmH family RNA methyltransferase [Raoultibacter timonensis]|uniref:rRNA methyltransferase n=1 Tax=Raoultibacter timonensis TaxID=1907662 RepID=A0ABM7WGG0_9ACTN|nr:RNA methyltransferase [Raoultibacter timonensis]BDE95294.1 rRNA methyltransferase [Raoultibacter timonensis]BDF49897.1 rRNA methyltransferase [Raoultibacter timonensis]